MLRPSTRATFQRSARVQFSASCGRRGDLELQGSRFALRKTYSTLSNVRVATMVCPVRENVTGVVVIVRFFPLISK